MLNSQLRKKLRLYIFLALLPVFAISFIFIGSLIQNMTRDIAKDYARFNSIDLMANVNSFIQREVALTTNIAGSEDVLSWLKNEYSDALKYDAYLDFENYKEHLESDNFFIASERNRNFYFLENNQSFIDFVPVYQLEESSVEDRWYFRTKDEVLTYELNVDVNKDENTARIWINQAVYDGNEFLGVLGTGLLLNPFVEEVFNSEGNVDSKSVIIDKEGVIQLDSNVDNIYVVDTYEEIPINQTIFGLYDSVYFRNQMNDFMENPNDPVIIELKDSMFDFVSMSPIEGTDWYVATFYDANSLFNLTNFIPLLLIVIFLYVGFSLSLNQLVLNQMIKPLEKIKSSIENDEFDEIEAVSVTRIDEIGDLAVTINGMKLKLEDYSNQLQEQVELQSEELDRIFNSTPIGIVILRDNHTLHYTNDYFNIMFSIKGDVTGTHFNLFASREEDSERIDSHLNGKEQDIFEVQMRSYNNRTFWCELRILKFFERNERYYQVLITDISKKKEYEQQLIKMATKDALTGICNRRYFEEIFDEEMERSIRYNHDFSLILFDIDFFKKINDEHGHEVGDEVLIKLARIMETNIRTTDTFARWGGEEFIILLPETTLEVAYKKAENLRCLMEETKFEPVKKVTASFGVVQRREDDEYSDMFKRVDRALYDAKESGRNCVKKG